MPFDPKNFSNVTVLPPTTEPGGAPRRIRVEIEIVQRRPEPHGYRFGAAVFWLVMIAALCVMFGCAPVTSAQAQGFPPGACWSYDGVELPGGGFIPRQQAAAMSDPSKYTSPPTCPDYKAKEAAASNASLHEDLARGRQQQAAAIAEFQREHPGVPLHQVVRQWWVMSNNGRTLDCTETRDLNLYHTECH